MKVLERARSAARAWSALDIVRQYAIAAVLIIGIGMGAFGWWVASRIERGVIEHAAGNAALHVDSFIEPLLQDLASGEELSSAAKASIKSLETSELSGQSVRSIAVYDHSGRLVYATSETTLRENDACVKSAVSGNVASNLDRSGAGTGSASGPTLRICVPIHREGTSEIIAVAEIAESAGGLVADINKARFEAASILALLSLLMAGSLLGIVRRGGRTIEQQKDALAARVIELSGLLEQNNDLQRRLVDANRRSTDTNDRLLKRISAELHDGPVQLIALALLRLEGAKPMGEEAQKNSVDEEFELIENVLRDALKEIRGMSSGLSIPKLETSTVEQAIEFAVRNHERRSRTRVKLEVANNIPKQGSKLFLTCLYRFIQEGLNNAFRHANGKDQAVHAFMERGDLVVEVRDGGPGFAEKPASGDTKGLGLVGLSDRVETLGGKFDIVSKPGSGTCLSARFGNNALENIGT